MSSPFEGIGKAASVEMLGLVPHCPSSRSESGYPGKDPLAVKDVALEPAALVNRQRPRLQKDRLGQAELSDIV